MKKLALFTVSIALLSACKNSTNEASEKTDTEVATTAPDYQYYGDSISLENAIDVTDLLAKMEHTDSLNVKVEGVVLSSCKKKGCWMKMDLGNDEQMMVKFKDYDFFVPKNLDGEVAIVDGYAKLDTTTVAELKHLAYDAEKSQEEIDAITEDEISVRYIATGVVIKPKS